MQQLDMKSWSAMPSLGGTNGHDDSFNGPSHTIEPDEHHRLDDVLSLLYPSTIYVQHSHPILGHIHSLRLLTLSNGADLLLKGSPSSRIALLRRERSFLETEAQFLALLGQSANPCIPQLYYYDPRGRHWGSAYLIRQYIRGRSLSEMEGELTSRQRDGIDRHLGFLVSTIGQNAAPGFGSLQQVAYGAGRPSWKEAFCAMCEGVLRDAEDMFIHLPYSEIRHELTRLAPALEDVSLPRLVVVDFGRPSHVLLNEESKQLSGIVDFSSALWGDVLMAEIFANPSKAVLQGAGMSLLRTREESIRLVL
ncbi:Aminoglycoside phosphotransferase [Penicillium sp. IBT 31633x]|nr:Aminoglycoside phosphotransferase [Penicillium sp. IBT 31633x]